MAPFEFLPNERSENRPSASVTPVEPTAIATGSEASVRIGWEVNAIPTKGLPFKITRPDTGT